MAVTAERVTVGTSAVALNPEGTAGTSLRIVNGAAIIFLGAADVTAGTGFEVPIDGELSIEVDPGDVLFAITSTGTSEVQVLRT